MLFETGSELQEDIRTRSGVFQMQEALEKFGNFRMVRIVVLLVAMTLAFSMVPQQAEYFSDSRTLTGIKSVPILTRSGSIEEKVDGLNSAEDSMAQYILDYLRAGMHTCFSSCEVFPCYPIPTPCCGRPRKRRDSDDNGHIGNPMQDMDSLKNAGLRQRNKSPDSRSSSTGSFGYELELLAHRTVGPPLFVPERNPSDMDPEIDTQRTTERATSSGAADISFPQSDSQPSHPPSYSSVADCIPLTSIVSINPEDSGASLKSSETNRVVDSQGPGSPDHGREIVELTTPSSALSEFQSPDLSTSVEDGDDFELIGGVVEGFVVEDEDEGFLLV